MFFMENYPVADFMTLERTTSMRQQPKNSSCIFTLYSRGAIAELVENCFVTVHEIISALA